MFAFLTDLVRRRVFYKIKAGFLMVGHTHKDIDQYFSVISQHLKQLHIICPDQPSLLKEIQNAFKDMSEKPEVIVLSAFQIIDYIKFRFKAFKDSHNLAEVVLVHYKQCAQSAMWLPCNVLLEKTETAPPTSEETRPKPHIPMSKKRKMSRHSTTKGQLISQVTKKKLFEARHQSKTELSRRCS